MKRLLVVVLVVGLVVGALFLGKMFPDANATAVDLDLLWVRIPNVPLWILVIGAMTVGGILASLFVGFFWLRSRLLNRRYRKAIKRLESELHQMRSLPLSGNADEPALPAKGGLFKRAKRDKTKASGDAAGSSIPVSAVEGQA